ncbi:hypothetical protein N9D23_06535 [Rubripirellula sp.]|jgi:hypothetical protein|nr:hypothetical protein [Rubripirellula sp.]MDF1839796.1 hypothetical protein [Rubripirellula sp.]
MSTSNVRNIESLEVFHAGLLRLSGQWSKTLQEVRMTIQRADAYFTQDLPGYWRRQRQIAERELNEAKDRLAEKQAAVRPGDRMSATEATKRVHSATTRLQECEAKCRQAKAWALEISQRCDQLLGPLVDVVEHCEVLLPTAADELRTLIEQLRLYADQPRRDG